MAFSVYRVPVQDTCFVVSLFVYSRGRGLAPGTQICVPASSNEHSFCLTRYQCFQLYLRLRQGKLLPTSLPLQCLQPLSWPFDSQSKTKILLSRAATCAQLQAGQSPQRYSKIRAHFVPRLFKRLLVQTSCCEKHHLHVVQQYMPAARKAAAAAVLPKGCTSFCTTAALHPTCSMSVSSDNCMPRTPSPSNLEQFAAVQNLACRQCLQ